MEWFNIGTIYNDFRYPKLFIKALELNLVDSCGGFNTPMLCVGVVDFDFWYFMSPEQVMIRINGLIKRYPKRKLIPFTRRDDNDDIACFEVGKGQRIQIIHDFASEGYEQRGEYNSFEEWMKVIVDELIRNEEK